GGRRTKGLSQLLEVGVAQGRCHFMAKDPFLNGPHVAVIAVIEDDQGDGQLIARCGGQLLQVPAKASITGDGQYPASAACDCSPQSSRKAIAQGALITGADRSEEHTSELQSRFDLVCRLLLEKKN